MTVIVGRELLVPDAIYAYQLDGKGGVKSIDDNDEPTSEAPCWLHLDYEQPAAADWLAQTPLLPDTVRGALSGESTRPRISRLGKGMMITLRGINFDTDYRPDQLVTLRIYINDQLMVSTRHRKFYSIDGVIDDLHNGCGPTNSGRWLVEIADALTDHVGDFIENLHDKIIELEDALLEKLIPERGELALIRKQLIIIRRYMTPQRDIFSRLAVERLSWMSDEDRHRMQAIADRVGRELDDLDSSIARTAILSDEITTMMADAMNRRTYIMSIMAMIFLPTSFLTGLFGVNLGGIPGSSNPIAFAGFCFLLILLVGGVAWWFRRSSWL